MSEEERKLIQALISDMFERFKSIVKEGRPAYDKDPAALDMLATGEIFTAEQALKNKLIDKIGFVEDAIDRAIELANLNKSKTRIVKYKRPITLMDGLTTAEARHRSTAPDFTQVLDFCSRPCYLTSTFPALVTSRRAD